MAVNKDRLKEAIQDFSKLNILVVGDIMLDIYDFCVTEKSKEVNSEKKGKRAYWVQDSKQTLGGAGNVALNLLSLGANASLVGVCGDDPEYHALVREADKNNLNAVLVQDSSRATIRKKRIYVDEEYILRLDYEDVEDISSEISGKILESFKEKLALVDAVILSDYGKGVFTKENSQQIIGLCHTAGIPTIVDFKPENVAYFKGSTIMSPNFNEARQLLESFEIDDELSGHVDWLSHKLAGEQTVVTLHDQGICGQDKEKNFFHLPANPVSEVDAVGCGDTVRSLLALAVASKLPFEEMLALANDGAAIAVTKQGTSTITPEELLNFIQKKY